MFPISVFISLLTIPMQLVVLSILTSLFFLNATSPISEGECQFKKMKNPWVELKKKDANGKFCKGDLELPICMGYCKSSESPTVKFPNKIQNTSICDLDIEGMERIELSDCDEGADDSIRFILIPIASRCLCRKPPHVQ